MLQPSHGGGDGGAISQIVYTFCRFATTFLSFSSTPSHFRLKLHSAVSIMSASQSNNTNALHLTSIEMRHVRERKLETNLYGWNLFNPDEKLSEDEINANSKVLEGMLFLVTAVENHNYDDLNWRIRIPRCPEGPLSKKGCLEYLLASLIKPSIMDSILIPTVELDDLLNSDDSGEIWILTSPVTEDNKTRIYGNYFYYTCFRTESYELTKNVLSMKKC